MVYLSFVVKAIMYIPEVCNFLMSMEFPNLCPIEIYMIGLLIMVIIIINYHHIKIYIFP